MLLHLIQTYSWIAASIADVATINPNSFKTLLANGLSTFLIKSNPVFYNGPENLPKNTADWLILCNRVFDNFILADEPFAKALRKLWNLCIS